MKRIILVWLSLLSLAATTQSSTLQKNNLAPLLPAYYEIKNALIASDAPMASGKAEAFVKMLKSINLKTLAAADAKAFKAVKSKLQSASENMAGSKDLAKQREYFAEVSAAMYTLTKSAHLSAEPVYQMYCPMKKVYWLSNESGIKNPYYGKSMLDCGSLTETIK